MRRMPVARGLAWSLVVLTVSGCSSWKTMPLRQPVPGESSSAEPYPGRIRVNMLDGSMLEMEYARVDGDSLVGTRPEGTAPRLTNRRVAVSVMEVRSIEARQASGGKTGGLLAGIAAVVGVTFLIAAFIVAGESGD